MTKAELDDLAKKYNVVDWMYVSSPVFTSPNNITYMVQNYSNVQSLFKNAAGRVACIYKIDCIDFYGVIVTRGTIIDK